MTNRGKVLVSLALQSKEGEMNILQTVPNQNVGSNDTNSGCCSSGKNDTALPVLEQECEDLSGSTIAAVPLANIVSGIELKKSGITERVSVEHAIDNSIVDILDYVENSDDSVKDPDYRYESEEMSLVQEFEETAELEYNEASEEHIIEVLKGRPKKGRKRKYLEQDRKIRKKNNNSNEKYYSAKGKLVDSKPFVDFHCSCKNDCNTRVSVEDKKKFFDHYWGLADYNVQTAFISTNVREEPIKRKTLKAANPTKRHFSRLYQINKVAVCRDMFVKTLGISTKRVNTSLFKSRTLAIPDRRGVAGGHNKMSKEQREIVINHINKFPKYKSHYCRTKRGNQEFLPIGVTVPLMYQLYKEETANCVSLTAYRKIFLTEFNLKTKLPKKDTCNKCDVYQIKIQNATTDAEKQLATSEHDSHLKEAEMARGAMNMDIKIAAENDSKQTLTFDMEKTLPLPRLSTNIIFYKRQLWLYNCRIYAGKNRESVFHIWIEGQAGRGAQEVGSCLRKYIRDHVDETVRDITLWSDSCGGQNRNIKMILILKCILEESNSIQSIRLRFLVSGHSFLPNDNDFGDVECALKRQQKVFSPLDYIKIMETCRRKNSIVVNVMNKEDFVTTKNIEKRITNRKKTITNEKLNWLHMKEIKVVKEKPYSIFYKTKYDESDNYEEINIKKGKGKQPEPRNVFGESLQILWPEGKPVAQAKIDDIKSYMHLIPAADHQFYTNLTGDIAIDEDIEGFNGDLDFQLEVDEQEA